MLRKVSLSLFILLVPVVLFAQPSHFSFTSNTGESYSIVINNVTLNGSVLDNGDEIGVFTPAGLCVGASVWAGTTPVGIAAWKDDSQTSAVDGYVAGETMSFKIWDKSANQEYEASPTYTMGNGTFGDGFAAQLSLTAGSAGTESIAVVAPNGGEDWQVGTQHEIKWTSSNFNGQLNIEYSSDGGSTYTSVANNETNDGSYLWTIPNTAATNCLVKVSDAADGDPWDVSDAFFTISSGGPPVGELVIVTNTQDSGEGSFREAINKANTTPGRNIIVFNIPKTDPGYDTNVGVWSIVPQAPLPAITDEELIIDGFSQAQFIGEDTNPLGPEIQLDGSNAGGTYGIRILASFVDVIGLIINNFDGNGIDVSNIDGGRISACYIGVAINGFDPAPNGGVGVSLQQTHGFQVTPADTLPNIISGNKVHGIYMVQSKHNLILGNIIGLNIEKLDTLGNGSEGILMMSDCDSNEIIDNFIGGNKMNGINLLSGLGNSIANNVIGCNREAMEINLGNSSCGITVSSSDNLIIENFVAYNKVYGIKIYGSSAIHNTMSRNIIFQNGWAGIKNENGGNNNIAAPILTNATMNSVTGTALSNATVEVFADETNQGRIFLATVMTDASGNFSWTGSGFPPEFFFIATATDAEGNTSEFSNPLKGSTEVSETTSPNPPDHFSLHHNYPNPFNPETTITFEIPKGKIVNVNLSIYNLQGQLVRNLINEHKAPGTYTVQWNGKNDKGEKVAAGAYLYTMTAGNFRAQKKMVILK